LKELLCEGLDGREVEKVDLYAFELDAGYGGDRLSLMGVDDGFVEV
jgi:hypothetical protein